MEHILQFGISIDDEAIKKRVEEAALKEIVSEIVKDIRKVMFQGYGGYSQELTLFSRKVIQDAIAECKDDIVEKATVMVADSMRRSKKYREALEKVVEDVND